MANIRSNRKRKRLSRREYDKRIKVWGIVVPLITAMIGSLTTVGVAWISRAPRHDPLVNVLSADVTVRFQMQIDSADLSQLEGIRERFNSAAQQLSDSRRRDQLRSEWHSLLVDLADQEARILRKYDPGFQPRYPVPPTIGGEFPWWLPLIVLLPIVFLVAFLALRWGSRALILSAYEIEPLQRPTPQDDAPPSTTAEDPVFRAIKEKHGELWTVRGVGRKISDPRPLEDRYREGAECRIDELTEVYVRMHNIGSSQLYTVPLGDITISYDEKNHRPMIEVRRNP